MVNAHFITHFAGLKLRGAPSEHWSQERALNYASHSQPVIVVCMMTTEKFMCMYNMLVKNVHILQSSLNLCYSLNNRIA